MQEIFTPEQTADYLQVDKETIYRYIRQGKLLASKLGRKYRIQKNSIDLFLWATRTREDIALRNYTIDEINGFLQSDRLDKEAVEVTRRFPRSQE